MAGSRYGYSLVHRISGIGMTAVMLASKEGKEGCLRLLIAARVNLEHEDKVRECNSGMCKFSAFYWCDLSLILMMQAIYQYRPLVLLAVIAALLLLLLILFVLLFLFL